MPPSRSEVIAQITPTGEVLPADQRRALERAARHWNKRTVDGGHHAEGERFIVLLDSLPADGGDSTPVTDLNLDVMGDLITGLQRRYLRDVALEFTRPSEPARARELWALLARHRDPADQMIASGESIDRLLSTTESERVLRLTHRT